MLQELLALRPEALAECPPALAGGLVATGVLLGVIGARSGRPILSLLAVAAGAYLGLRAPRWYGWGIEPAVVAVVAALALGVTAFLLHRAVLGAALALILTGWTAVAVWIAQGGGTTWSWPDVRWTGNPAEYLSGIWRTMPGDLGRILPYACALALIAGVFGAMFWPRLGRVVFFSLLAVTLAGVGGAAILDKYQPGWVGSVPADASTQVGLLATALAISGVVQWFVSRHPAHPWHPWRHGPAPRGAAAARGAAKSRPNGEVAA